MYAFHFNSTVHINYMMSYIHHHINSLSRVYKLTTDVASNAWFIAQLLEHHISHPDVIGPNLIKTRIVFLAKNYNWHNSIL